MPPTFTPHRRAAKSRQGERRPSPMRDAVMERVKRGMSYREIAAELGISRGAVAIHSSRGRSLQRAFGAAG